jgi:hypothetical protein
VCCIGKGVDLYEGRGMSLFLSGPQRETLSQVSRFRGDLYGCLTARRDELFELVDAVLCADGPVKSPVDLTLTPGRDHPYADSRPPARPNATDHLGVGGQQHHQEVT